MKQLRYTPRGTKVLDFTKLSPNALHNALLKLYPSSPDLRISEKERILAEREALRVERITKDSHATLWTAMIRQLEIALNTPLARVRRAKQVMDNARGTPYEAETGEAQERLDAYRAYVALLEKLLDKLRYHRDTSGKTPMQLGKEKNMPNGGRHWADWLPEEIKHRFHIAFDGLNEARPLVLFPDTVFTVSTKKRKVCPSDTLKPPGTVIEQIRDKLRAADKATMLNPTPENLALRDTLILAREEAIRDKNRANVRKYAQVRRTAMQEWKVKHMAALEKLRLPKE